MGKRACQAHQLECKAYADAHVQKKRCLKMPTKPQNAKDNIREFLYQNELKASRCRSLRNVFDDFKEGRSGPYGLQILIERIVDEVEKCAEFVGTKS
jgi:hypothetical protein